ncbi:hypothetical protein DBR06_SOUSAS8910052, partial [Sousa chinensis]
TGQKPYACNQFGSACSLYSSL